MTDLLEIKQKLARAAITLHALPHKADSAPMGYKSAWPEMRRISQKGAILKRGSLHIVPNSKDISDCYLIIDCLYDLTEM